MTSAYGAFELLEVKEKAKRVSYIRFLSNISYHLGADDNPLEYATEVSIHELTDDDRGFAYGLLGSAYDNKGEYDKAIGYYEKALAISTQGAWGGASRRRHELQQHLGVSYNAKGRVRQGDPATTRRILGDKASRSLVRSIPTSARSYNNIGWSLRRQGRIRQGDPATTRKPWR